MTPNSADFRAVILLCLCTIGQGQVSFGKLQSPINITTANLLPEDENPLLTLTLWHRKLSGDYVNTGHTVKFTPSKEVAKVTKGSQKYKVCEFHIHWGAKANEGSEHVINGKAFAGELHIVSVKDTLSCGALASYRIRDDALVIGVFLKLVNTPIASTVWQELSPVPRRYNHAEQVSVQLNRFLPNDRAYFFYEGSLTTKPYNEIVQWHVLKNPVEIPEDYLRKLRSTLNERGKPVLSNFRNIKPLNGREIWMCRSNKCMISP